MSDMDKYKLEINKLKEMFNKGDIKKRYLYKNNYSKNTENNDGSIEIETLYKKPLDSRENSKMKNIINLLNENKIIKTYSYKDRYNNKNKNRGNPHCE